jgi:hypothetical protein
MASTYSALKIQLMGTGENSGTWGTITNTNLGTALEEAIVGSADVTFASGTVTLTLTDTNSSQTARNLRLNLTGTSGGAQNLIVPAIEKVYLVNNGCADAITVKNTTGTGIAVPAGKTMYVYNNGTNVVDAITHLTSLTLATALPIASGGTGTNTTTFCNLQSNVSGVLPVVNGGTGVNTSTGTGSVVLSASPTFTGVPLSTTAANGTNTTQIATTAFVTNSVTIATGSLGTMSTQNANAVAITGGTISGITDLAVADGGTGVSTISANAVILGNGTSAVQTVAPGTSGNLLTSNGTTWASITPTPSITSGTAQNTTSGTNIDFTSIPSTVKRITVMFSGVSTNGSSDLLIQLGDSGGVETTGYNSLSTSDDVGSNLQSTISSTSGILIYSRDPSYNRNGSVIFSLLNASTNTWVAQGQLAAVQGNPVLVKTAGSKALSATLDRIRITTANGTDTFDAGTINILYE